MQTFLSILFSLLLAWGCSRYAARKGRNPAMWFCAGAFFGIFALIALFIIPIKKPGRKQARIPALAPTAPPLTTLSPEHAEKMWYYLNEQKERFGPMSLNALSKAWHEGLVKEQTFVWNEAMENWLHFKSVMDIPEKTAKQK